VAGERGGDGGRWWGVVAHLYHPDGFQCALVGGYLGFLGSLGTLPWWSLSVWNGGWNKEWDRRAFGIGCDSACPKGVAAVAVRSLVVGCKVSEVVEMVLVLMKDKTGST
jgi:hypothetical protein